MSSIHSTPSGEVSIAMGQKTMIGTVRDAVDDSADYFSARSHVSDNVEAIISSPDSGAAHVLSEAENQRLNAKIDRLIAALTNGHSIRFARNLAGEVDVFATHSVPSPSEGSNSLEANIAAAPHNYGNIISSRRQMIRSQNSTQGAMTSSTLSSKFHCETWEEAVAEANDRYEGANELPRTDWEDEIAALDLCLEVEQGASLRNGVKIRRALRLQEQAMGISRGSRLAVMGTHGVEIHEIHPIPLNFEKALQTSTPSVSSTKSQCVRSSPLIRIRHPEMVQYAESWVTTSDSHELVEHVKPTDRVWEWLERVQTPPQVRTPMLLKDTPRDFKVLRDTEVGESSSQTYHKDVSNHMILHDISNLRRPGYLNHNSITSTKPSADPHIRAHPSAVPPQVFGGAVNTHGRQSYIKSKCPGLLSPVAEQNCPMAPSGTLYSPERMAHFELALARLEGRVPPEPSSPIRRYVHDEGVYGDHVEVDLGIVRVRQPRPVRYPDGPSTAQQFERALGENVDPEAHLEHTGDVDGWPEMDLRFKKMRYWIQFDQILEHKSGVWYVCGDGCGNRGS